MREDENILDSWKEIARYLDRTVKTCRKWEKELGLPIHRLDGSLRASVFAYKEELDSWLDKMLHSHDQPPKQGLLKSRKAKLGLLSIVFIGLVIISYVLLKFLPSNRIGPISSEKPSLAILYFENNTGDKGLDHWRKMLADLLTIDLMQSQYIHVLNSDTLYDILNQLDQLDAYTYSADVLNKVANRANVSHVLIGKYARMGEAYRIDVVLKDVRTGKILSPLRVEAHGEKEIFAKVDELTRRIKTQFRVSEEQISEDIDSEVGKITTSSPEAFNYYIEGKQYFVRGDYRKSIQLLENAVAIDPKFAMAYRKMAVAYHNLEYFTERKKYAQKAFELIDHVSERERYQIQGYFFLMSEKTYDKALEAYKNLLQIYPEDYIGNSQLGWIYNSLGEWDKAIEHYNTNFELSKKYKIDSRVSTASLAFAYMAKGLYDKATEVLEYFVKNIAENPAAFMYLTRCYLCQGKYSLALAMAEKTFSLNPGDPDIFYTYGDIFHLKGDLEKAEKEYQKLFELEEKSMHSYGREKLSAFYLLRGKFEKAKKQAKKGFELMDELGETGGEAYFHKKLAYTYLVSENTVDALKELEKSLQKDIEGESLSEQRWTLFMKGLAYIKSNSIMEAQNTAEELKELIEEGMHRKHWRYYYHLLGMIELNKDNFSDAIDNFNKALTHVSSQYRNATLYEAHALFIEPLALSYYESGDIEKTLAEYEKITKLTTGRLYYGNIYAKSFYMLGKIYEQQGNKAKAIENYGKFLDLWKDADPGIAEVEDARGRVARLKEES